MTREICLFDAPSRVMAEKYLPGLQNRQRILKVASLLARLCEKTLTLQVPDARPFGKRNVTWVNGTSVNSCTSMGVISNELLLLSITLTTTAEPDRFDTKITALVF